MSHLDPLDEYLTRLERWREEHSRHEKLFIRIGNWRLGIVLATAAGAWLAFYAHEINPWLLLAPGFAFIGLLVYHEQVARRQQLAARAISYYESGLARLDDRWPGRGNAGERFEDRDHIYSGDLDLFGKGSLFELICIARTAEGEQRLAQWLLARASSEEVRRRQEAVTELRERIQLREDLALLGDDIRAGVHAGPLAKWGLAPQVHFFPQARLVCLAIALFNAATFAAFMSHAISARPFLCGLVAALVVGFIVRRPVQAVCAAVESPAHDLSILSLLLERLEQERFASPLLVDLRKALDVEGMPASRRISRLARWVEFLDSCDHVLVRVIGPPLLWRQQVAMGIEGWRASTGEHVADWVDAIAQFEALGSLAALSFERPNWCFAEIVEGGPLFEADTLTHPLMSPKAVANDVALGGKSQLLVVSGSNMSGKSTLMRSVGINAILAWAGGPCAAKRLRISALAVGASMRTVDSLQDGRSRFYAEITRLRAIMDLAAGETPALFLLDELLSGTNSHDRRIGAEAIVRGLVERGATGLVTTHDLALTQIVDTLDGRAANVHFEDDLQDGRMHFDYTMRPGVVVRSNALELMRAVGLKV